MIVLIKIPSKTIKMVGGQSLSGEDQDDRGDALMHERHQVLIRVCHTHQNHQCSLCRKSPLISTNN